MTDTMDLDFDQISQLSTYIKLTNPAYCSRNVFSISASILAQVQGFSDTVEEDLNLSTHINYKRSNSSEVELRRDIKFLTGFIKTVKFLKIYSDASTHTSTLDLSKFQNLQSLEVQKINLNSIKGLQKLRSQLQKLTCDKTSNNLNEVLSQCGADKSHQSLWNNLKELTFTNNDLVELDLDTFEFTPWLHTVDLSRNQISANLDVLSDLVHLKSLNLSYNKLDSVPCFKGQICSRLQNLILKNNFIEDINGLQTLTNLWVLDLSNNSLVDHKCLLSISHSATLQWLSLNSNPLSCHPHHRVKTCSYLHTNTASTRFMLDHKTLSKNEKKVIGTLHPISQTTKFSRRFSSGNLGGGSGLSLSGSFSESLGGSGNSAVMRTSTTLSGRCKVREVTIFEDLASSEDSSKSEMMYCTSSTSPAITVAQIQATSEQKLHLQTKRQIEELRERYGDSWLKLDSGILVQSVLGLENITQPLSCSPYDMDFLLHSGEARQELKQQKSRTPPLVLLTAAKNSNTANTVTNVNNVKKSLTATMTANKTRKNEDSSNNKSQLDNLPTSSSSSIIETDRAAANKDSDIVEGEDGNGRDSANSGELYTTALTGDEEFFDNQSESGISDQDDEDLEDGEHIYLAHHLGADPETQQILIVITKSHLTEKSANSMREKSRWHIRSVIKCTITNDSPLTVRIEFDTMRKNRQQRTYVLTEDGPQGGLLLVEFLNQKIKERENETVDDRVNYQCMKCNHCFSRSKDFEKDLDVKVQLSCPSCDSNLVFRSS